MAGSSSQPADVAFRPSSSARRPADVRLVAGLVAMAFLLLILAGCVHTRVRRHLSSDGRTAVAVSIFLKKADWRDGGPTVDGVVTELYRIENGRPQLIRREDRGSWADSGLVPGSYEARLGRLHLTDGAEDWEGDTSESFTLAEGESADVRIILEKKPVLLIAGLGAAAVAVAVILHKNDIDLPEPPGLSELDTLAHHLPPLLPPAEFLELGVQVMVPPCGPWGAPPLGWPVEGATAGESEDGEFAGGTAEGEAPGWPEDGEPAGMPAEGGTAARSEEGGLAGATELLLTDHAPVHGSDGVPRDTEIRFQFTLPVDPASLDHRCLLVTNAAGERIAGGIDYLQQSRTCVFDPLLDLPPGQTITVTISGGCIRTSDGRELVPNYRWSFTTSAAE